MAVPSVMADLSTTANSNSPAGTESPSNADDFLRALQAIVRTTNAKGSDIDSSATTDIGAATGEFVDVTGTTTITGLGTISAGIARTVRFTGALTLTHNDTSLILPGSANITTANGDMAIFRSLGSGNWKCVSYIRQNGQPIVLAGTATSDITMSSASMIWSKGADVASANALPLITDGNYFDVTGTTAITSMNSMGVGTWVGLQFDGALTLTHNATDLILPGDSDITTAAGDHAVFVEYASGDWRCVSYQRANNAQFGWVYLAERTSTGVETGFTFSGIPSWATEIEWFVEQLSTNGSSDIVWRLGDAGGIETTNYIGAASTSASTTGSNYSTGFLINQGTTATQIYYGMGRICRKDSATNTWIYASILGRSDSSATSASGGNKALSATLTQLILTTVGNVNTFDSGAKIRVRYR